MPLLNRLLRVFAYGIICWLALAALWLGLPSPSRESPSQPGRYALDTLRTGQPLIRIYDNSAWSQNGFSLQAQEARHSFALTYRLEQQRNTTLLSLGDGLTIDLNPDYIHSYPFTSQERFTQVKTGDQDGINPPWFARSDSALLFWWIHRDMATLQFQVTWMSPSMIELEVGQKSLLQLVFETTENRPSATRGSLKEAVLPMDSSSPSRTYALRVIILALIVPTGMLGLGIFSAVGPILEFLYEAVIYLAKVLGFYCAVIAAVWIVRGRRPIAEDDFVSRFPGMEFFGGRGAGRRFAGGNRTVWGPSGPLEVGVDRSSRVQRRPIRNVADFFRSSAPLDDLLASFDSTRRWTEPVRWSSRSGGEGFRSASQAVPEEGLGRHRKVYSEDGFEESGLIDLEKVLPEKPGIVLKR